jgi:PAS domain S-box-containing protein
MTIPPTIPAPQKGWLLLVLIAILTVAILLISVISLLSGWLTIFQNLFYFPIILACVYYVRRGFVFSVLLACGYFLLMAIFSQDPVVLQGALIRVMIFILVAGVITYLSIIRIMAEEALKESEEFNRGLVENMPDLVVVYGHDRKIRFVNPAAIPVLGYQIEEMVGTDIMDYVVPRQRAEIAAATQERFSSGSGKSLEVELITKGNQHLTVMTKGVPLHFHNQPAVLVLLADISDRKRAEEALRESEERFRTIIHSMQFGIVIIDAQTHTILDANVKALEMIGGSRDIVSGSVCHRFICPAESGRCPVTDLKQTVDSSERVLLTLQGEKIPILKSVITTTLGGKEVLIESFVDITDRKHAEEALRESERRLWEIIDFLPDPTFVIDADGKVIAWNYMIASLLGVEASEIIGKGDYEHAFRMFGRRRPVLIDLVIHGNEEVMKKHYPDIRKERGMLTAELDIPNLRGKRTVLWIIATPLYNAKGEITGAIESMRDITPIHDTEVRIRESEQRLTDIIDFLPDPTFAIDTKGIVIAWNRAIEEMMGVSKADVLGKGDYAYAVPAYGERRPVLIDLILNRDAEQEKKYTSFARRGNQLIAEAFAPTLHGGKGEYLWMIASPLYNQNGTITGAIESIRIVTEQKVAEEKLRETRNYLENLISYANAPIIVWNPEFEIIRFNHAFEELTGRTEEKVLGKHLHILFPPESCSASMGEIRKALSGERWEAVEIPVINIITEEVRTVLWNSANILNRDGTKVLATIAQGQDITDRKHAEEAFKVANKKLNLLSSITRHDINNQLMVLQGYLRLLEKKVPDPALDDYFTHITNAGTRISAMIQFTRTYESIGVNAPVWQDVRTLVDAVAKDVALGHVRLANDLPSGAEVYADPLIIKVFYNLMENAVHYGGKITTTRFSVEKSGDDQLIVCEDDGVGVPANEKEKIFERGYGKNTGLGLFLSREILTITGITIRESGEPGKGARFEITVPKGMWRFAGKGT